MLLAVRVDAVKERRSSTCTVNHRTCLPPPPSAAVAAVEAPPVAAVHAKSPRASPSSASPVSRTRTNTRTRSSPSCTDEARCCPCELMPASTHARPVCAYSRSSATRSLSSRSSATSAAHMASPDAAGADLLSASRLASRILAASPAMSSAASRRTRSRSSSTSMDGATPVATAGRRTTASSSPATSTDCSVAVSRYVQRTLARRVATAASPHVKEEQEAALLVGVELADVHRGGAALRVDAALVAAGLDRPDAHAGVQALDGDARILRGDGEEPADAPRERVLDDGEVLDEGEGATRDLRDAVHGRRVVVGAEPERVHRRAPLAAAGARERRRHEDVVAGRRCLEIRHVEAATVTHGLVVLAVGEEDDAGDGVGVAAAVEHLGVHVEAVADVGVPVRDEGVHRALGRRLPVLRHARGAAEHPARVGVAKATTLRRSAAPRLSMTNPMRQLVPGHARADVEHRDQVQRRAPRRLGRRRGRLGVHQHGEAVARGAARERRVLAVRLEHQHAAAAAAAVARRRRHRLHRVVVVVRGGDGGGRERRRGVAPWRGADGAGGGAAGDAAEVEGVGALGGEDGLAGGHGGEADGTPDATHGHRASCHGPWITSLSKIDLQHDMDHLFFVSKSSCSVIQ
ncbi:hypothetical protein DAI22_12g067500 [Oryza sativa Japonica Group]|nr:hypothetical protein DAI22_12g067500 [Oryza sativa Japonica Group]